MEDLGRIVIDVNATGGGGAGGGQGSRMMDRVGGALTKAGAGLAESGAMALAQSGGVGSAIAGALSAAGPGGVAVAAALGGMVVATVAVKKAFDVLNNAAKRLTESLRDYSPAVMIADAMNDIKMMQEKFQAAATYGPQLAQRQMAEGRIDRALFQLSAALGGISAAVVTPILEMTATILEAIVKRLVPAIFEAIRTVLNVAIQIAIAIRDYFPNNDKIFWTTVAVQATLGAMVISLDKMAAAQQKQANDSNEPFLADLRLMGATI